MSTPLTISFVVPIYKIRRIRDRFDALIQSLLAQTYPHTEIIFVNDASPDNSADILQDLAAQHSHIRILTHSRNQGQGPARNTGAAAATGDYIWFVDQDDLVAPNACQILAGEAQNHGLPDVICFDITYPNPESLTSHIASPSTLIDFRDYHRSRRQRCKIDHFLISSYISCGTPWRQVIKTRLAQASTFPDFYPEDIVHTLGVLARTHCILYVNATLYCWKIHPLSTSSMLPQRKGVAGHIKAIQKMREIAQDFAHKKELSKFFLCHDAHWTRIAWNLSSPTTTAVTSDIQKDFATICPRRIRLLQDVFRCELYANHCQLLASQPTPLSQVYYLCSMTLRFMKLFVVTAPKMIFFNFAPATYRRIQSVYRVFRESMRLNP